MKHRGNKRTHGELADSPRDDGVVTEWNAGAGTQVRQAQRRGGEACAKVGRKQPSPLGKAGARGPHSCQLVLHVC